MEELRPLLTAASAAPGTPEALQPPEPGSQPAEDTPAPAAQPESVVPPPASPPAASAPRSSRGLPKGLIIAGAGILGLVVLGVIAVVAFGGDSKDDPQDASQAAAATSTRPAATRPAPTPTSQPSPTPEPELLLVAAGDVEGSFQHVVAVITGDCSPLQLASGPVQIGSVIPGAGTWGLGALDPATGLVELHTADGLAGRLNPDDLSFEVATADNARSGNGTFSQDGASFTGKSFLSPAPGCSLELDSTATFASPLFRFEAQQASAVPAATLAGPAPAATAVATTAPAAPTQPPVPTAPPTPTQPPLPDIPALIQAAVTGEYTQAIRSGNSAYLLSHLDPIATSFYGQQACTSYLPTISADPTFTIQINGITGPASWTWMIYGETVGTIPDAYTLQVTLTQRGNTVNASVHFAWNSASQQLRVYSPCHPAP